MKRGKASESSDSGESLDEFEVPEGWQWDLLGNITKNFDGKRIPIKSDDRKKRQGPYPYYGASGVIDSIDDFIFDGDFLLIGEDGANLLSRSTPIAFQAHGKFWVNNHAHIVQTNNGIPLKFLEFYINSLDLQVYVTGSAQPKITQVNLNSIPIPLPPLAEQKHIVARVEALLSQVNAARDRLSRVPLIMKKFRQAVLAAACEGRLTEGWRGENPKVKPAATLLEKISVIREKKKPDHLKKVQLLNDELNDLPENWIWTQIGIITESMKNGVYKTPDFYNDDGFPCLRMYNIEDGKIIWKNIKHMDLSDDEIETYLLKQNDILINRVNSRELVGKSALITEEIEPCVYESKNIRLRMFNEEIDSQYVVFWLQVNAQKYFNLNAQQTVGMASINQDQIASMPIPLPPLTEQHEIVRRINGLFEKADQIEQQILMATKRTEGLTQAVLGKAFAGKL